MQPPVNARKHELRTIGLIHDEAAQDIEPMRLTTGQGPVGSNLEKPEVQPHASSKRKADRCSPRAKKAARMQLPAASATALSSFATSPALHKPQSEGYNVGSKNVSSPPFSVKEQMALIKLSLSHGTATGLGECCERLANLFCRKESPSDVALAVTGEVTQMLMGWFRQLSQSELRPRNTQLAAASKVLAALVKMESSRCILAAVDVDMVQCVMALLAVEAPPAPDDAVETMGEPQYVNIEEDALSEPDDPESSITDWNQHLGRLFFVLLRLAIRKDSVAAEVKKAVQSPMHLRSMLSTLDRLQFPTIGCYTQLDGERDGYRNFLDGDYQRVSASATWNGVRVLLTCDVFSATTMTKGPILPTLREGGALQILLSALVLFGRDRRWLSFTSDGVCSDAHRLARAVERLVEQLPIESSLVLDDFRLMLNVIYPIHVSNWRKSYDMFPHADVLRTMAKIMCRPVCDPWWNSEVVRSQGEGLVQHILTRAPSAGMRSLSSEEAALVVKILQAGSNRLALSPELYERHRAAPGLSRLMQVKAPFIAEDAAVSIVPNRPYRFFV